MQPYHQRVSGSHYRQLGSQHLMPLRPTQWVTQVDKARYAGKHQYNSSLLPYALQLPHLYLELLKSSQIALIFQNHQILL